MAKSAITGLRKMRGNKISHSNIKTKRWQAANLQERRIFVPELGRHVRLVLSTRDMRSIDKLGLAGYAKSRGVAIDDLLRKI